MRNIYWWEASGEALHESLYSYVEELQKNQIYREDLNERHLRLYGSDLYAQGLWGDFSHFSHDPSVQYNIIRSVCDTMTSTIAYSSKPTPFFQIRKGDWSIRRKAQKLERFMKGEMNRMGFYAEERRAFLDSTIFGTGCLHFYANEANKISCEKVWPGEIVIDEMEAIDSPPLQIQRVKPVHRKRLAALYPKFREEIAKAERWQDKTIELLYRDQDMVRLVEGIHLPTLEGGEDGKIARVIQGATLREEAYPFNFFPYAFMRWSHEPRGFFGRGIAQLIIGLQINLNILLLSKAEMLRFTVPKIIVHKASGIKSNQITNRIGGTYVSNTTNPIEVVKLGTVPQEIIQEEQNLYQKGFELSGISQLTAISKLPSRLDSSLALNEALDIQSMRFAAQYARRHDFIRECAKIILSLSDQVVEQTSSYKAATKWKGREMEVDYHDIQLDPQDYSIEIREMQDTPDTPWGRTEILQQFLQAGLITSSQFMEYNYSGKDLEGLIDEINADENNLEWTLEELVENDIFHPPEPYQNIVLGISKMQKAYLNLKTLGCPEEKLENIRRWINQAQQLEQKKMLAVSPTTFSPLSEAPGETAPLATPETPATSELIPLSTAASPETLQ